MNLSSVNAAFIQHVLEPNTRGLAFSGKCSEREPNRTFAASCLKTISLHLPQVQLCLPLIAMPTIAVIGASVRAALLEQTERTRRCSKAEIERIIEESEREIISLQSQIDALVELRDSYRARVYALKHIVSPIHSLPVELLAKIFDLAIKGETHIQDAHRISHVCSDWRRVAHSTPRLWTRPLQVKLWKTGRVIDGLKAWLARSEPMAARVSLVSGFEDINREILEEVLRVVRRLGSLDLPITRTTPSWLVAQLEQSEFDGLEELHLRVATWIDPALAFTTVPRLRKLRLINFPRVPQTLVPWAQITDLTLSENPHDVTFGILAMCPNLVVASITTCGFRYHSQIQPNPLVLGQLHTLTLHSMAKSSYVTPFFSHLSTPLLQSLRVNFRDSKRSYWSQTDFTAFQLRAPNIAQLEFANSDDFTPGSLEATIRSAPSLTHLTIALCTGFDDSFIRALRYRDGVPPIAPCLQNLVVHKGHYVDVAEDVLAAMIASRWWTDAEFASLEVPPAVTRWTYVELDFRLGTLGSCFMGIVKHIPSHVLRYAKGHF
ncbi:F-box domain-containing protein [Mycena sanguinolenta]|uniref:F-box domain-containing protein n=1 Tax=Mycena sanguinolenta TaxID=230812 RepID=A0A8H7D0Y3_9AGAR|nr:F-box domain-containing protein [Mycena sanguinolenta]